MNKIYPPIRTAQYQLWEHGGQYNPPGMFWDGQRYRKGNANTGMQYMYGGQQYPPIRTAQYQLWENGGQVPPIKTAAYDMYEDGGIHIKPENRGKFTSWAKSHGMGVQEAASHVMANKEDYSSTVVKRANFAKNFGGKRQYGGLQKFITGGFTPGEYEEDPYRPADQGSTYVPPTDTGVVQQRPPAAWRQGMTDQQAEQNIDYGVGSMAAYNPSTGNTMAPQRTNPWQGMGYATDAMMGAVDAGIQGMGYINNMNNARDVHRGAQNMGLTGASGWGMNPQGAKGDYHPNTGAFRPQSYVPANAGMYYPTQGQYGGHTYEHGGQYQNGGEYELDTATINRLKKLGYKLQEI